MRGFETLANFPSMLKITIFGVMGAGALLSIGGAKGLYKAIVRTLERPRR